MRMQDGTKVMVTPSTLYSESQVMCQIGTDPTDPNGWLWVRVDGAMVDYKLFDEDMQLLAAEEMDWHITGETRALEAASSLIAFIINADESGDFSHTFGDVSQEAHQFMSYHVNSFNLLYSEIEKEIG